MNSCREYEFKALIVLNSNTHLLLKFFYVRTDNNGSFSVFEEDYSIDNIVEAADIQNNDDRNKNSYLDNYYEEAYRYTPSVYLRFIDLVIVVNCSTYFSIFRI